MLVLKNLLFTRIVPGTVGVYLPLMLRRGRPAVMGPAFVIAIALLAVGGAIYAWCVYDFASFGRGTPLPLDAPKKLVKRALYRFSRNPIYVGVLTVILGWAVLYRSAAIAAYALAVAVCFHSFVVLYEERRLRELFDRDYEQYCAEIPRWLFR
jgi:protein-S-isoprenylcysteine O-methyltransferase Ste14